MATLEYDGHWWDPQSPEARWVGRLVSDPIEGAMLTVVDPQVAGFNRGNRTYDVVLGVTTSGRAVSLLGCFDRVVGGSLGGPGYRTIYVHQVLDGFHCEGRDPLVVGLSAVLSHAAAWWNQPGISLDRAVAFPDATVHYRKPQPAILFKGDDLEIKIAPRLRSLASSPDDGVRFSLQEDVRVEVLADTPRSLSSMLDTLHACQDLLSIACRRYCVAEHVDVYQSLEPLPCDATYHAVPVVKPGESSRPLSLLFRFRDLAGTPVFSSWLSNMEALRPVRALYFLSVYGKNFIEGRFLAIVQAIEAFHRRLRDGVYMDPSDFDRVVVGPLIAAVPTELDATLHASLVSRIRFGNEYSLRKRLRLLFAEHRAALDQVAPDASRFINVIVDRRNMFTHFPPEKGRANIDGQDWLRLIFLLRLVLECCFLKAAGFTDDRIRELIGQCDSYRWEAERWFGLRS